MPTGSFYCLRLVCDVLCTMCEDDNKRKGLAKTGEHLDSSMGMFHYWGCFKAKILTKHQFGNVGAALINE